MPRAERGPRRVGRSRTAADQAPQLGTQVQDALSWLEKKSTTRDRDNLARFGITAGKAFGVSIANIQALAKRLGRDHDLAAALWDTGWYEARLLASFVDEPASVTPRQMDRWCRDFDNWGICDTVCFHLFDRTEFAWAKVGEWHDRRDEFVRRAAFALFACLALHDKRTGDAPFLEGLVLIEQAATDERNFVKKGVSWALRLIGRRNAALNAAECHSRAAPVGIRKPCGALDRQGRGERADQPAGDAPDRHPRRQSTSNAELAEPAENPFQKVISATSAPAWAAAAA